MPGGHSPRSPGRVLSRPPTYSWGLCYRFGQTLATAHLGTRGHLHPEAMRHMLMCPQAHTDMHAGTHVQMHAELHIHTLAHRPEGL